MRTVMAVRVMVVVLGLIFIAGCTTTRTVQRVSVDEVRDLSGRWNSTDSRLVAEEMVSDVLRRPWLSTFERSAGRQPVVIVGTVRNRSSEHIEMGTFVKDIERELINSGVVRFVASSAERSEVRDERLDQQSFSTEETAKRLAAETGADYMLQGSIKTLIDAVSGQQVKFYQVDMELIHVENNEKVWIGSKKIKKVVRQARARL